MTQMLFCGTIVIAIAAPAHAQQTWTVNCNGGPGVDFTDLPQAVAAAAPGDTIRVYYSVAQQPCPGGGYTYTAPLIDKPLRIQGFIAGGASSGSIPQAQVVVRGVVEIRGIPSGGQVVVSGIASIPVFYSMPPTPSGLLVSHCDGDVLLENFAVDSIGWLGCTARIEDCAHVVLRGSEFRMGDSPFEVFNSNVTLTTTAASQHAPLPLPVYPYNTPAYTTSQPGLWVDHSTVTLIDSVVDGGWVSMFSQWQPGVFLDTSTLRIGPATTLRGAYLGSGNWWRAYESANPSQCMVRRDPRSTLLSTSGALPQAIPTTISSVYHGWVVAGQPYGVTVAGPANVLALLVFGDLAPSPTQTIWGPFAATVSSAIAVDLIATDAQGLHDWTFSCPSTAPIAMPYVFQALILSGAFAFTEPSPLVVGWPFGAVP